VSDVNTVNTVNPVNTVKKPAAARRLFPAEAFVKVVEVLATFLGHDHHVLDPDAAYGFAVQSRFDRHDVSFDQLRTTCGQEGWLVDLQA
jgi:hypothetical protein